MRVAVAVVLGSLVSVAFAAPPKHEELPDSLKPWTKWVLHGQEAQLCPFIHGGEQRLCTWPGRLQLQLDNKGGRFTQSFRIFVEGWAPLPGDAKRWPQNVKVGGRDAVVTAHDDAPSVLLPPGEHTVTGEFAWDTLPEALELPSETGLLSLTVRGKAVQSPNREASGQLFLQKEATPSEEAEHFELKVHRKVTDEIPLLLTTRIELNVAGKSREVLLGKALPEGFVPMSVSSSLPARVEADGRIRVQARAGSWWVELVARHDGPVASLKRPAPEGPWTEGEEVWVFDARPFLRQVLVEGVNAIDPQQTTLPGEWKRLPAYSVSLTEIVALSERRRGDADPAPDVLNLSRTLWLDFDGKGYTANDRISGALHRSWRLDMQPGTDLGRVVASGSDQFITRLKEGAPAGVELREGLLNLEADSRIPGDVGHIPAVSWDADFHQVSGTLNLPPGWRLFHASGVDEVRETWVHQWSLLELFLVLIIALAFGRLFGVGWGALALVTLTLCFPEDGAPQYIWLFVLAGEALSRVLPEGRFRSLVGFYRFAAWIVLVVPITIPFLVQHVRHGLYPALEREQSMGGVLTFSSYSMENAAQYSRSSSSGISNGWAQDQTRLEVDAPTPSAGESIVDGLVDLKKQDRPAQKQKTRSFNVQDYDKSAVVQTGPGLPRWSWTQVTLGFSGPVQRAQQLSLWLMPPWLNLLLAFLRVALLCALALRLMDFPGRFWPKFLKPAGAVAAVLVLLVAPGAMAADAPSPELLGELRNRLLEKPACTPSCASSPRLFLEASPRVLKLKLELHAAADTAVPLPGSAEQWVPDQVLLDGRPATAMLRTEAGQLLIAVTPGSHVILMEGPLPGRDTVQLALPLKSHRVEAKLEGWTLDGLHEDGLADDDLQLSRNGAAARAEDTAALTTSSLPAFVSVERELMLGLEWRVETKVRRLTPTGTAVVLEVPLLAGESVTTQDVRVQNGKALVNIGPQATEASWSGTLEQKSPIALKAPAGLPWVEVWRLDVSPVWHVELTGIPVIHAQDSSGARLPEWRPWPGEGVNVDVVRPGGVHGQTLTIDQSELKVSPGLRATDVTLTANLRSSRGGQHVFTLPDDAQLQSVTINGSSQPIRQDGQKVAIPLVPGSQSVVLSWRQSSGIATAWETPKLQLGTPSANADLHLNLSQDRWVLFVSGPRMGPAVLFWSLLLVLLLISIGLGRVKLTPLGTLQWVLLTLGLSQVPIPAAAVVVGWLLVLGWREKRPELSVGWFDLRQLMIAGWTLAAVGVLFASIYQGLLGHPDMQVTGNASSAYDLRWFADRTTELFPRGWVVSVPMLVYRGAMLGWSLWLALALLRWLKWGWTAFSAGGLWRSFPAKAPPPPPAIPPVA
jgi:hypothetical protein